MTKNTDRTIAVTGARIAAAAAAICIMTFSIAPVYADTTPEPLVSQEESQDAANNMDEYDSDAPETVMALFIGGHEVNERNCSGTGWSYDEHTNTLTLDSYTYEGTGEYNIPILITETDDSENDEDYEYDDEDYDDGDYDDTEVDDEGYEDDEIDDEDYEDDESENNSFAVMGVIFADGDLTLHLTGESCITVTDKDFEVDEVIWVNGELNVTGDGVLHIKSAGGDKEIRNDANNTSVTNDTDQVKGDNQTVNEAPVIQDEDDGDVNVSNSNNVSVPDINNKVSLPDVNNNIRMHESRNDITFNPNINLKMSENKPKQSARDTSSDGKTHAESPASAAPEKKAEIIISKDIENENAASGDRDSVMGPTVSGGKPRTADSNTIGKITALITSLVVGCIAIGFLIKKRFMDNR